MTRIHRAVVSREDVPVDRAADGRVKTRKRDILDCGHKKWTKTVSRVNVREPFDQSTEVADGTFDPYKHLYQIHPQRICTTCEKEETDGRPEH